MRIRIGMAVAALVAVGACGGGSDGTSRDASPTPTEAAKVSLADTCPKIQDALDSEMGGGGLAESDELQAFTDQIKVLRKDVDPKGVPLLNDLVSASQQGADNLDTDPLASKFLAAMERVTATCQQLGAPLS